MDAFGPQRLWGAESVVITYRRTGGLLMLLAVAAAALAATVFTVAVAGTVLIVSATIAAVALLGRAVLPLRWRRRRVPPVTRWPHQTIDATAVDTRGSSDTRHLSRAHDDTR